MADALWDAYAVKEGFDYEETVEGQRRALEEASAHKRSRVDAASGSASSGLDRSSPPDTGASAAAALMAPLAHRLLMPTWLKSRLRW